MGVYRARSLRAVLAGSLLFGGIALALAMPAQIAGATITNPASSVPFGRRWGGSAGGHHSPQVPRRRQLRSTSAGLPGARIVGTGAE